MKKSTHSESKIIKSVNELETTIPADEIFFASEYFMPNALLMKKTIQKTSLQIRMKNW